jgi:beta-glucanase (GH16 family)
MKYLFKAFAFFLMLNTACNTSGEDELQGQAPTNLTITKAIVDSTLGIVEVTLDAEQANYYKVEFFEKGQSTVVDAENNVATYDYNSSGTFKIIARAYSTFEYFIELEDEISITLPVDSALPTTGYSTPLNYPGYNLVWQDEFDGNSLKSHWTHEIGTGSSGWGNNELQYYTANNTEVKDGILRITARKEPTVGQQYSSSRIITQGAESFQYGRIDIRAALPYGQGIWPALWMLGDNFSSQGWPRCGEIDIMEMVGGPMQGDRGDNVVHGTLHWEENGNHVYQGGYKALSSGRLSDEFHVFTIIWDDRKISWYLDDEKYYERSITSAQMTEFKAPFFFIFNVAVGGNWPGSPNANTVFPQTMAVDYVRVFQK